MNKKELFIKLTEIMLASAETHPVLDGIMTQEEYDEALNYFEALKMDVKADKPIITDNGKLILKYLQEQHNTSQNLFTAKSIADGIFISSRSVSGSMQKLKNDGFVEKVGDASPAVYSITLKGLEFEVVDI